jgi:hypothetical protein
MFNNLKNPYQSTPWRPHRLASVDRKPLRHGTPAPTSTIRSMQLPVTTPA